MIYIAISYWVIAGIAWWCVVEPPRGWITISISLLFGGLFVPITLIAKAVK